MSGSPDLPKIVTDTDKLIAYTQQVFARTPVEESARVVQAGSHVSNARLTDELVTAIVEAHETKHHADIEAYAQNKAAHARASAEKAKEDTEKEFADYVDNVQQWQAVITKNEKAMNKAGNEALDMLHDQMKEKYEQQHEEDQVALLAAQEKLRKLQANISELTGELAEKDREANRALTRFTKLVKESNDYEKRERDKDRQIEEIRLELTTLKTKRDRILTNKGKGGTKAATGFAQAAEQVAVKTNEQLHDIRGQHLKQIHDATKAHATKVRETSIKIQEYEKAVTTAKAETSVMTQKLQQAQHQLNVATKKINDLHEERAETQKEAEHTVRLEARSSKSARC